MSWNLIGQPREVCKSRASDLLASGQVGDFFVRSGVSSGPPGSLGLSLVTGPKKLENFLIEKTYDGLYRLRQSTASFSSADDLVVYFSLEQHAPLPVKLNGLSGADGPLYEQVEADDDEDTKFGFGQLEDDEFNAPPRLTQSALAGFSPPLSPNIGLKPSGASLAKLDVMRKQTEVLAAKRRAAEQNLRALMEKSKMSTRERVEQETARKMEEEMAAMKNQGLLSSWKAQLEEVDRHRSKGRSEVSDNKSETMFGEISQYENSFANKMAEVSQEEQEIAQEEARLLTLDSVVVMLKDTLYSCADVAVMTGEHNIEKRRLESELATERERMSRELEAQRKKIAAQEAKIQETESIYAQTHAELQNQQERLSMVAQVMGFTPNNTPRSPTYGRPSYNAMPARGSGSGSSYQPSPARPRGSVPQAVPASPSGGWRPSASNINSPANGYSSFGGAPMRSSVYERIPGDPDSDDDGAAVPTTSWRNSSGASKRNSFERQQPEPVPNLSVVKFKKPVQRDFPDHQNEQVQECTFLGNCTCPNCR